MEDYDDKIFDDLLDADAKEFREKTVNFLKDICFKYKKLDEAIWSLKSATFLQVLRLYSIIDYKLTHEQIVKLAKFYSIDFEEFRKEEGETQSTAADLTEIKKHLKLIKGGKHKEE